MKYINNGVLCIEYDEFVKPYGLIPKGTYDTLKDRGAIKVIGRGGNGNHILIEYETLPGRYQELIIHKFGNPYEYAATQPIKNWVVKDAKAEDYFINYRFDNDRPLPRSPKDYVQLYSTAASWLNMIVYVLDNKKVLKKELNITLIRFWQIVADLIDKNGVELPKNIDWLRRKVKEYKAKGYECIISGKFNNTNTMRIGKTAEGLDFDVAQKQIALIRKAASLYKNFTPQEIAINVNQIFEKNGWATLSRSTISNVMLSNRHIITPGKRGSRIYNSTIAMQVMRRRPDFPLQYCTVDGWTVELLYQDEKGSDNRLVVVIVLDVMNNYPLGYAIGDRENTELIRQANRNAILHAKELFGAMYRPWQIQSDRYGIKQLTPFYESMTKLFTPAAVGNAKSKVIEPYFKDLNKHYCKYYPNWSGFNLTARAENQPNIEYLNKIKHTFPSKEGVIAQINNIIQRERAIKRDEYVTQWQAIPDNLTPPALNEQQTIVVFGKLTGYLNSIKGKGLEISIDGKKLVYDSFDPLFRSLAHLKWRISYEPENLEKVVAISENGKHSFMLEQKLRVGMAVLDKSDIDNEYLKRIRDFNKERKEEIIQTYVNDAAIVDEIIDSTTLNLENYDEARIKLMFTYAGQQKEGLQDAKKLGIRTKKEKRLDPAISDNEIPNWQNKQLEYLNSKADFNQYLD